MATQKSDPNTVSCKISFDMQHQKSNCIWLSSSQQCLLTIIKIFEHLVEIVCWVVVNWSNSQLSYMWVQQQSLNNDCLSCKPIKLYSIRLANNLCGLDRGRWRLLLNEQLKPDDQRVTCYLPQEGKDTIWFHWQVAL